MRNRVRRHIAGNLLLQRGQQIVNRPGLLQGFGNLAGQLVIGLFREPLGPVGRLGGEHFFQVDRHRGAVGFDRLNGDGASAGNAQIKTDHGLIDAADLFHVEGSVA